MSKHDVTVPAELRDGLFCRDDQDDSSNPSSDEREYDQTLIRNPSRYVHIPRWNSQTGAPLTDRLSLRRAHHLSTNDSRSIPISQHVSDNQTRPLANRRNVSTRGQGRRIMAAASLTAGLLVALLCGWQGWQDSQTSTLRIDDIQVGQRVVTGAPQEALDAADSNPLLRGLPDEQIDPRTWKLVRMRAEVRWDDGTLDDINVATLQSPQWLRAHNVQVGNDALVPLDLVEMGLPAALRAKVLEIAPCPPIQSGPGRVVLTTVNHLNADVHELTVRDAHGHEETIRTTGGHKFYSVTRNGWLSASDIGSGEQLDGLDGTSTVVGVSRLGGVHRVYNMTVQGEHVYRVSSRGALVHNMNCGGGNATAERALNSADDWLHGNYREIAPGVYRSNIPEPNGTWRQFRMTDADLTDPRQGPHVHFEVYPPSGRGSPIENSHVQLLP